MSANREHRRCHAAGCAYMNALVRAYVVECPPSIAYAARVNGAPPKPISGTRPLELAAEQPDGLEHVLQRLARFEAIQPFHVVSGANRIVRPTGPSPLTKSNFEPHRRERHKEVGKQDRRVDFDPIDRLERDRDRELRVARRFRGASIAAEARDSRPCSGPPAA